MVDSNLVYPTVFRGEMLRIANPDYMGDRYIELARELTEFGEEDSEQLRVVASELLGRSCFRLTGRRLVILFGNSIGARIEGGQREK